MDWIKVTDYVILAVFVGVVLYNIAAGVCGGGQATISARMQHYGYRFPIVVGLAFGLLCHWWWPVFASRQ